MKKITIALAIIASMIGCKKKDNVNVTPLSHSDSVKLNLINPNQSNYIRIVARTAGRTGGENTFLLDIKTKSSTTPYYYTTTSFNLIDSIKSTDTTLIEVNIPINRGDSIITYYGGYVGPQVIMAYLDDNTTDTVLYNNRLYGGTLFSNNALIGFRRKIKD